MPGGRRPGPWRARLPRLRSRLSQEALAAIQGHRKRHPAREAALQVGGRRNGDLRPVGCGHDAELSRPLRRVGKHVVPRLQGVDWQRQRGVSGGGSPRRHRHRERSAADGADGVVLNGSRHPPLGGGGGNRHPLRDAGIEVDRRRKVGIGSGILEGHLRLDVARHLHLRQRSLGVDGKEGQQELRSPMIDDLSRCRRDRNGARDAEPGGQCDARTDPPGGALGGAPGGKAEVEGKASRAGHEPADEKEDGGWAGTASQPGGLLVSG